MKSHKRLLCVALLAIGASQAQGTIAAAAENRDRLVPLAPRAASPGEFCTADALWCVSLIEGNDGETVLPVVRGGEAAAPARLSEDESANETHAVWSSLIVLKDGGFLAGVEARTSTAYSGGGGSATELRLFRISADGQAAAKPVLRVPIGASLMIRACFGERDMKMRRGACHDEYSFSADLELSGEGAAGLPSLSYVTEAKAFPRGVSRLEDSTAKPRLRKSDLVHERDTVCSFSRRFRFDAAAGTYQPDLPLPDCEAYTIP